MRRSGFKISNVYRMFIFLFLIISLLSFTSAYNPVIDLSVDSGDSSLDIAMGKIPGTFSVNKFGRTTNADAAVDTDIWDGANSVTDQDIWIAPTDSRYHTIVSTSALDNASGTGARTIQIYGLQDWNTSESSEVITLNGVTGVNTTVPYVIIHRIKVLTSGSGGPNVGYITATAQVDSTITAQINPQEGQTQMAIYGIPRGETAYMTGFYISVLRQGVGSQAAQIDVALLADVEPEDENGFLVKHTTGVTTTGSSANRHQFNPYSGFSGPVILKLQVTSSQNDIDASGGFDLIVVEE